MEVNRALELAVILGRPDFLNVVTPSIVRIEYEYASGLDAALSQSGQPAELIMNASPAAENG